MTLQRLYSDTICEAGAYDAGLLGEMHCSGEAVGGQTSFRASEITIDTYVKIVRCHLRALCETSAGVNTFLGRKGKHCNPVI